MPDYRSIFKHNNERPYICIFCGEECEQGRKFDVHHKTHNRKNNRVRNLAAAHKWCHVAYHQQVNYLYWFEKFNVYWFNKLPKYIDIEPDSKRRERWKNAKFNWRDPQRLQHLARSLPTMRYIKPDDFTDRT